VGNVSAKILVCCGLEEPTKRKKNQKEKKRIADCSRKYSAHGCLNIAQNSEDWQADSSVEKKKNGEEETDKERET
jgi:hypothetical protein